MLQSLTDWEPALSQLPPTDAVNEAIREISDHILRSINTSPRPKAIPSSWSSKFERKDQGLGEEEKIKPADWRVSFITKQAEIDNNTHTDSAISINGLSHVARDLAQAVFDEIKKRSEPGSSSSGDPSITPDTIKAGIIAFALPMIEAKAKSIEADLWMDDEEEAQSVPEKNAPTSDEAGSSENLPPSPEIVEKYKTFVTPYLTKLENQSSEKKEFLQSPETVKKIADFISEQIRQTIQSNNPTHVDSAGSEWVSVRDPKTWLEECITQLIATGTHGGGFTKEPSDMEIQFLAQIVHNLKPQDTASSSSSSSSSLLSAVSSFFSSFVSNPSEPAARSIEKEHEHLQDLDLEELKAAVILFGVPLIQDEYAVLLDPSFHPYKAEVATLLSAKLNIDRSDYETLNIDTPKYEEKLQALKEAIDELAKELLTTTGSISQNESLSQEEWTNVCIEQRFKQNSLIKKSVLDFLKDGSSDEKWLINETANYLAGTSKLEGLPQLESVPPILKNFENAKVAALLFLPELAKSLDRDKLLDLFAIEVESDDE